MSDPTKIRLQVQDDRVIVRLLMAHDMENGLRKDGAGKLVPAWFIQEVSVLWNGKPALTAQFGPSVSKNPFLQFTLRGPRSGDRIGVNWVDNRGERRSDEALLP